MYLFSDIHGNYSIWQQIKEYIGSAPAICLGDVADRGPDGYRIIKEILATPNIIYLKGNHEDLFVQSAREMLDCQREDGPFNNAEDLIWFANESYDEAVTLHLYNGGGRTLIDFFNDGMNMTLVDKIAALPISFSLEYEGYPIFDICHAGCPVTVWQNEKNYRQRKGHLLQSRTHFEDEWIDGHVLIHGHTWYDKIMSQIGKEPAEFPIYNSNKICLDMRTFKTGKAIVLKVPSLNYKIFEEEK